MSDDGKTTSSRRRHLADLLFLGGGLAAAAFIATWQAPAPASVNSPQGISRHLDTESSTLEKPTSSRQFKVPVIADRDPDTDPAAKLDEKVTRCDSREPSASAPVKAKPTVSKRKDKSNPFDFSGIQVTTQGGRTHGMF